MTNDTPHRLRYGSGWQARWIGSSSCSAMDGRGSEQTGNGPTVAPARPGWAACHAAQLQIYTIHQPKPTWLTARMALCEYHWSPDRPWPAAPPLPLPPPLPGPAAGRLRGAARASFSASCFSRTCAAMQKRHVPVATWLPPFQCPVPRAFQEQRLRGGTLFHGHHWNHFHVPCKPRMNRNPPWGPSSWGRGLPVGTKGNRAIP